MLQTLTSLPLIGFGDFNVTVPEFMESGWMGKLGVQLLDPGVASTTTMSPNRPIDFGVISNSIHDLFVSAQAVFTVPWGPHCGILFRFNAEPSAIQGLIMCVPKSLPLELFTETMLRRQQKYCNKMDEARPRYF